MTNLMSVCLATVVEQDGWVICEWHWQPESWLRCYRLVWLGLN